MIYIIALPVKYLFTAVARQQAGFQVSARLFSSVNIEQMNKET
jgi:hypothetical protein